MKEVLYTYDEFPHNDGIGHEKELRYGVISWHNGRNGFINTGYRNNRADRNSNSVIFNLHYASVLPEEMSFDVRENIYLVRYAVSGTTVDPKTGILHPKFDYTIPIRVLKAFPYNTCIQLTIRDEGVLYQFQDLMTDTEQFKEASVDKGDSAIQSGDNNDTEERENTSNLHITLEQNNDLVELDRLFYEGEHIGFLSSEAFSKYSFCALPTEYQEKALNCAARLLFPEETEQIKLTLFQKELISAPTTADFIKKWKGSSNFSDEVLLSYTESSLASLSWPADRGIAARVLDSMGRANPHKLNNNYAGLITRFADSCDRLYPHMCVLKFFANRTSEEINSCISEYCQTVKDLKRTPVYTRIAGFRRKYYYFTELLRVIFKYAQDIKVPSNVITNIVSTYVDCNGMEELKIVMPLVDPGQTAVERRLLALYFQPELWQESDSARLLNTNASIQLFQKIVACVWEKYVEEEVLPECFLKLLSWICIYDSHCSLDEVIRYHFRADFTKLQKQQQLLRSYKLVCSMTEAVPQMYALASYIMNVTLYDISENKIPPETQEDLAKREGFSDSFYQKVRLELGEITAQNESDFTQLLSLFKFDHQHWAKLQADYANWFCKERLPGCAADGMQTILDELIIKNAYDAYVRVFAKFSVGAVRETDREKYIDAFITALIQLRRYGEAAVYIRGCATISEDERDDRLTRVMAENFRNNMLSKQAFLMFGPEFTVEQAISLLMERIGNNLGTSLHIVNSLMALYCHRHEYIKVNYLYQIFRLRGEKGYTRLYAQIRKQFRTINLYAQNHYDVVEQAFYALDVTDLIDFFQWAQRISIPEYRDYKPRHAFAFSYDRLIAQPMNEKVWSAFLGHISKRIELNAWKIVVCEAVSKKLFADYSLINSRAALEMVLEHCEANELPYNLLPYIYSYIRGTNNTALCVKLSRLLEKKEAVERLFSNNPWIDTYKRSLPEFKTYILDLYKETGKNEYYNILVAFDLDMDDLVWLAQSGLNKKYVFSKLCRNYLLGEYRRETIDLLNNGAWSDLSFRDAEMLKLLRTIISEDELLLLQQPALFKDEYDVQRFKRDCASILVTYPEKDGLIAFDRNCIDTTHKLIVYSYVFSVFYNEDIYLSEEFAFENIALRDERMFFAYLAFLRTSYLAQLEWNITYDFFYKKWRYLKLLLNIVITSATDDYDDAFIISAMEKYGHYTNVFLDLYQPFKEDVTAFMASAGIDMYTKKYFLAALMVGQLPSFLRDCADALICVDDPARIRRIVEKLDYRNAALGFYMRFEDDIRQGRYEKALAVANTLSAFLCDAVTALKDAGFADSPDFRRVYGAALQKTPSYCVTEVFWNLGPDIFTQCAPILVPILYSRQFQFQVIKRLRIWILSRRKDTVFTGELLRRFECCSAYFAQKEDGSTENAYLYLSAFRLCLQNERERAKEILSSGNVRKGIPAQWIQEAERMYEYAYGSSDHFVPDDSASDSSIMQAGRQFEYTFIRSLQDRYAITKEMRASEKPEVLYELVQNKMLPLEERLQAGLTLLYDYPSGGRDFPSKATFLLEIGLQALEAEIGLPADEQLRIAAELFEGNIYNDDEGSGVSSEKFALLKDRFREILYKDISLRSWVEHVEAIKDFLRVTGSLEDFTELDKRILQPCSRFFLPECPNEERYEKYTELQQQFKGIKSVFAQNICEAIRRECTRIDSDIRLRIEIANQDGQVTDGCVYFQLVNVGKRTVSLETDKITVVLAQENYPKEKVDITGSVNNLQKGFVTGGRAALKLEDGMKTVRVSLSVESAEPYILLSETEAELVVAECQAPFRIMPEHRYDTDFAVRRSDMLFGRDTTKEALKRCIRSGLAVIYGPSRIGKTSLLNWVRQFAREKENVMTILFGGEGGFGKEKDYRESFTPKYREVPYYDHQEMSEYLLVQTIVQGLKSMTERLYRPQKVSNETLQDIVDILLDDDESILSRYNRVNDLLTKKDLELWLLMDEFQDVVERWKDINASCAFASVCQGLCYSGGEWRIRLIFCGSDDLLLHMVLTDDSEWRKIFPQKTRIAIEPLEEKPFHEMIRQDEGIRGANIRYSDAALKALYTYTGGVALYGKEICNVVLDDVIHNADRYQDRNTIYVSDIAKATQTLIRQQDQELTTMAREGIRKIYDAVTKNLKDETDKQYLWYMASWLHDHPDEDGFAESIFTKRQLVHGVKTLRDSLAVAMERRIIKRAKKDSGGENVYTFCTIFYYYAFLGESRNHLDMDLIFASEKGGVQELSNGPAEKIKELFSNMDEVDQSFTLGGLAMVAKEEATREKLKQLSGTSVHISVQSITNTLTGILAPGADAQRILEGIQKLPRLKSYLPQLAAGDDVPISEERISLAMNSYAEDLREGMEGAIAQGIEPERTPNWKILNMPSEEDYVDFTEQYNLSEYFLDSLQLAYQLDRLFQKGAIGDHIEEVDYSPVTIMYCKLVESLLKEYHLAVYAECLMNLETDMKNKTQKYKWSEIIKLPLEQQQKLTIGSFVHPLINKPWCLSKLAKDTKQDIEEWARHREMISMIRGVRNPSAHGNKFERITATQKNAVTRTLLEEGGLLRLIRIAG